MSSLSTCCFLLLALVCQCPKYTESVSAEIFWAPSDLIVPLGQAPAVFQCGGLGSFLLWWIGDDLVVSHKEPMYETRGFSFMTASFDNGTKVNTLTITATVENNNTRLRCHATGDPGPVTSENAFLTVAGPPLAPQPAFHVVNATHIEVEWYKPFTFPEFDVRNYTLSIWNPSSASRVFPNQVFTVSEDTKYPIRHYINNNGNIPDDCVYLNFTLTASSDVGSSSVGFTTGGFAIGITAIDIPLIDVDSLESMVISQSEGHILTLVINFTLPDICSYQQATYSFTIYNEKRQPIVALEPVEFPDETSVVVYLNVSITSLASEKNYEVEIVVESVVSTNSIQKTFVNDQFNGISSSEDKAIRCTVGLISIALTLYIVVI